MMTTFENKLEAVQNLSDEQYRVTQGHQTEPAFANAYWDNHQPGIYVDIVSGEPLFSSNDKFDSESGWPSFSRPIDPDSILMLSDARHGMERTEIRSSGADSHLGHLFADGPRERGGLRYCVNSAALRFIPFDDLETAGYGGMRRLFPPESDE